MRTESRSFAYWRSNSAARCLADRAEDLEVAIAAQDCLYFSGITLAILDPQARETFFATLRRARNLGKSVVFDPNLRPKLWQSPAEMKSVITQAAALSDVVLPSFEDEATHFGDREPGETIRRYAQGGANVVVVKDGAAPVRFFADGGTGTVPVDPVAEVIDSTAAGDSFNAGFLACDGQDMDARIRFAAQVAGRVVQGKGALVPIDL